MNKVIVTDINMKFMSMVKFMVKWVLASIPAMVVLVILYVLIIAIITLVFK